VSFRRVQYDHKHRRDDKYFDKQNDHPNKRLKVRFTNRRYIKNMLRSKDTAKLIEINE
jgi:hypothetical protein